MPCTEYLSCEIHTYIHTYFSCEQIHSVLHIYCVNCIQLMCCIFAYLFGVNCIQCVRIFTVLTAYR